MNRSKLTSIVIAIHEARVGLLLNKGADYAGEDVLANFKRVNNLCKLLNIDPRGSSGDCARFLMMLKIDRWCNLIGKTPKNEAIEDTIRDLHNYIDLAYACDVESWTKT